MASALDGGRYVKVCPVELARWIDEQVPGPRFDSRKELLDQSEVGHSTFDNWRNGANRVTKRSLLRIAANLGLPLDELVQRVSDRPWSQCCKSDERLPCGAPRATEGRVVRLSRREGSAPLPMVTEPELDHYLAKVESLHRELPLAGFETRVRVPVELDDLYVPLDAVIDGDSRRRMVFSSAAHAAKQERSLGERIEFVRAFGVARQMGKGKRGVTLLGDPGAGKTTHLKQMLLQVIRKGAPSVGLPEGTVPVFLALRNLRDRSQGLPGFIQQELRDPLLDVPDDFGKRLVHRGRLLLLLDGLDEVADTEERFEVARWIEDARRGRDDNFFLVSCRYAGYTPDMQLDEGFLELHLRPMSDAQVEAFVHNWYDIVERALSADAQQAAHRARAGAEDLLGTLRQPQMGAARVYEMTHNPLLLTTICLVHRDRGELPRERALLYQEAVQVLLERWRRVTKRLPVTFPARDARQVLQPVARWLHQEQGRIRASAQELEPAVSLGLRAIRRSDVEAGSFLRLIRDESGLLTGWGPDSYGFMHLGFQEYLAAREIRNREIIEPGAFRELAARFDDSWWQEVILLLLAQDDPPLFERFMTEVVRRPEFGKWAGSKMMSLCLGSAAGLSPRPLLELLRRPAGPTNDELAARQLAALRLLRTTMPEALAELEDVLPADSAEAVRRGWETHRQQERSARTLKAEHGGYELVKIPGGEFLMGSPEKDSGRFNEEQPQHRVSLGSFYLGRAPVTNAEYAEFLQANGEVAKPRYWAERNFNQPQQPVVGVSWHEARAYCDWAGLVLPTEAQWEYACRAGTTTRYWSGDREEDLARVGWYDQNSGGRLHPVAEKEPNPFVLHDMHGNVWEWCQDTWVDSYEGAEHRPGDGLRVRPPGATLRVRRGGGWIYDARLACSAARVLDQPDVRFRFLGFRPAFPTE